MQAKFFSTPEEIVSNIRGSAVPKYVKGMNDLLVGAKVIACGYFYDGVEFTFPTIVFQTSDGKILRLIAQADDECNGPGALALESNTTGHSLGRLCQTHIIE